jgi:hypothetical protein
MIMDSLVDGIPTSATSIEQDRNTSMPAKHRYSTKARNCTEFFKTSFPMGRSL